MGGLILWRRDASRLYGLIFCIKSNLLKFFLNSFGICYLYFLKFFDEIFDMNNLTFIWIAILSCLNFSYSKDLAEELCGTPEQNVYIELIDPTLVQLDELLKKDKKTIVKIQHFADFLQSDIYGVCTDIVWKSTAYIVKGKIQYFSRSEIEMVDGEPETDHVRLGILGEKYNLALHLRASAARCA